MPRMKIRPQQSAPRARDGGHHRVGSNRDQPFCSVQFDRLSAEQTFGVCLHGVDDISGERTVLRPTRSKTRWVFTAPDDGIGGSFDLLDLEAIQRPFVGGKIQDF